MSKPKRETTRRQKIGQALLAGVLAVMVVNGGRGEASEPKGESQDAEKDYKRPISRDDKRLAALKKAKVAWDKRLGPKRQVVDVVCLVEDMPGFLKAIALWDDSKYFPILVDDGDFSRKFIHAFSPSRVFKIPKIKGIAGDKETLWKASLAAVGRSWSNEKGKLANLKGDELPKSLGETTPGVVISHPESPALAGAIALAAGRFQPLLRWETKERFADVLPGDEAERLATELEKAIAKVAPKYAELGDDCDFATLAGDYPYRYNAAEKKAFQPGIAAFDDLVGRTRDEHKDRWAYTGRLLGDPASSVYRAMCALFLQPKTALCFNGYSEQDPGFVPYNTMIGAAHALDPLTKTVQRSGPKQSDLAGWHAVFSPKNRRGLVLITSHGGPTVFNILGDAGRAPDVPATDPTIVYMIHSYSAADPLNTDTIAGRWLDNGAYIYFGSLNEPYLESFRAPTLVADLIAAGLPLGVVGRMTRDEAGPYEPFARPWRLHYLGDPLYRIAPGNLKSPRGLETGTTKNFKTLAPTANTPPDKADDSRKLDWVERSTLVASSRTNASPTQPFLLSIRRSKLSGPDKQKFDAMLIEMSLDQNPSKELRDELARIPPEDMAPKSRRMLETIRLNDFHQAIASGTWPRAVADWEEMLLRGSLAADLQADILGRLSRFADRPGRLADWRKRLRAEIAEIDENKQPALVKLLRDEQARTEAKLRQKR